MSAAFWHGLFSANGRADRTNFALVSFFSCFIFSFLWVTITLTQAQTIGDMAFNTLFAAVLFVLCAAINWCAMIRRLHDISRSGWWSLLALVPLVNVLLYVALLCWPGRPVGKADHDARLGDRIVTSEVLA